MPPEPIAIAPCSGSSTSPLPVMASVVDLSATSIMASRLRRYLSVRQSFASSTAARISWPGYCSSFFSRRSSNVKASAVAPAKPAITSPLPMRRTLRALPFMTVWPRLTCPSPAMTTLPPFLTVIIVVIKHLSALTGLGLTGRDAALLGFYVSLLFTIAIFAALRGFKHARQDDGTTGYLCPVLIRNGDIFTERPKWQNVKARLSARPTKPRFRSVWISTAPANRKFPPAWDFSTICWSS
ncbi:conserved exported hypothetical protein [Agrobacterium salinitolerans str. Hayward 0363]|nr:conserved exported hypothetical protein [Agrobacterium salinitolerans str. Hayward 0363]